jgi:hypothetical protein
MNNKLNNAEYLSLDSLMISDGFINDNTQLKPKIHNKNDIFTILHEENPIIKLNELGMFIDKHDNVYKASIIEYLSSYNIINDSDNIYANYLISRTYNIEYSITNNITEINFTDNNISFTCPLYYLSITDINNNPIDNTLYTVNLILDFENNNILPVNFNKYGYINDNNQLTYNIFGKNKVKHYFNLIDKLNTPTQCIFNDYTDKIIIKFKNNFLHNKIKIEFKMYDIYRYGGFFTSGWLFN